VAGQSSHQSSKKAIEAWLRPGNIEDAAREIGITTKKLSGWKKNRVFMVAHRAAIRAEQPRCGNFTALPIGGNGLPSAFSGLRQGLGEDLARAD
jgi:hypothetical protein